METTNQASPSSVQELENLAKALNLAKRVIVVAGAGISTAAGIPDFRSKSGLYAKGQIFHETSIHDASSRAQLRQQSLHLHQLASKSTPTYTHKALVAMRDAGSLLRCYTQNIDLLEQKAGLLSALELDDGICVELHGSHRHLRCHLCQHLFDWEIFETHVAAGQDLLCPDCKACSDNREAAGKRRTPIGKLLPDIVRLGQQNHPYGEEIFHISTQDERGCPDFLLVLGTSLKVDGPRQLVRTFAKAVRASGGATAYIGLVGRRSEFRYIFDYLVKMDCDSCFRYLNEHAAEAFMSHSPTQTCKHPGSVQDLGTQQAKAAKEAWQLGSSFQNPIILD